MTNHNVIPIDAAKFALHVHEDRSMTCRRHPTAYLMAEVSFAENVASVFLICAECETYIAQIYSQLDEDREGTSLVISGLKYEDES